jgi:hypothetical protein
VDVRPARSGNRPFSEGRADGWLVRIKKKRAAEGFDTRDLKEATALLEELAA